MKEKSIIRISLEEAKNLPDKSDWQRLEQMSDEQAEQNALDDLDNQPLAYPLSDKLKLISPPHSC